MYVYQVDPSTGESEEEGYEDEYQLEDSEVQIFCACKRLNGKKSSTEVILGDDMPVKMYRYVLDCRLQPQITY